MSVAGDAQVSAVTVWTRELLLPSPRLVGSLADEILLLVDATLFTLQRCAPLFLDVLMLTLSLESELVAPGLFKAPRVQSDSLFVPRDLVLVWHAHVVGKYIAHLAGRTSLDVHVVLQAQFEILLASWVDRHL